MFSSKLNIIPLILEIAVIITGAFFLWYKFFLPIAYYATAIFLAIIMTVQLLTRKDSLALHILLLLLFLNSIYYIATNYKIIPFWDGNWDLAATKIFVDEGKIFLISSNSPPVNFGRYPPNILSIYSGWPLLHSLAIIISQVSGVNLFAIAQVLPSIMSFTSFLFTYLLIKKIGRSLRIKRKNVINFALLLYVSSAEVLGWQMKFVKQNLGLMLLYIVIYTFFLSRHEQVNMRKYSFLTIFFAIVLVISHHFTSVIMIFIFTLMLFIRKTLRLLSKFKVKNKSWKIRADSAKNSIIVLALLSSTFMFLWWGWGDFATTYVWRKLGATIERSFNILLGEHAINYLPPSAYYPESLRPLSVIILLTLRDLLIYVPAMLGLFIAIFKGEIFNEQYNRLFVILLSYAVGIIFILNYLIFRIEIFRIMVMALPLIALLSSLSLLYFLKNKGTVIVGIISIVLILSAFIGLWGHRFAPLHLYNPDINFLDIGERYIDVTRTYNFFNSSVPIDHFQVIWVDDSAAIVSLLRSKDYSKVMFLDYDFIIAHSTKRLQFNELICELHNFNTYRYFTGGATSASPDEGEFMRRELNNFLQKNVMSIRFFDDGRYRFWILRWS